MSKDPDDVIVISSDDEDSPSPRQILPDESFTSLGSSKEIAIEIDSDDLAPQLSDDDLLGWMEGESELEVVLEEEEQEEEEQETVITEEKEEEALPRPVIQVIFETKDEDEVTRSKSRRSSVVDYDSYDEQYGVVERHSESESSVGEEESVSSEGEGEAVPGFLREDCGELEEIDSYSDWEDPSEDSVDEVHDVLGHENCVQGREKDARATSSFEEFLKEISPSLGENFHIKVQKSFGSMNCVLFVPRLKSKCFLYIGLLYSNDLNQITLFSGEIPKDTPVSLNDYRILKVIQSR
jgi:hypothetical protein